jgi:enamine deaminase RidA (YjgF/YER057c/UK114 family)
MARIEAKLMEMGLTLPQALQMPANVNMSLPFAWVRVSGTRAFVSGHVPLNLDGTIAQPVGKVGAEVSPDEGYAAARLVALAQLASLQKALGDLDRITAWVRVFAMINVAPGFDQMPRIANGFSDLILELFGPDVGIQ